MTGKQKKVRRFINCMFLGCMIICAIGFVDYKTKLRLGVLGPASLADDTP